MKKMKIPDMGRLNDAKFHIDAMNIVLGQYPKINELHVQYFMEDEEYACLPKCIQLNKLHEEYPEEIAEAKRRARLLT